MCSLFLFYEDHEEEEEDGYSEADAIHSQVPDDVAALCQTFRLHNWNARTQCRNLKQQHYDSRNHMSAGD